MSRKKESISLSTPSKLPERRKRGAQPGNSNALKHGFYARHFNPNETTNLDHVHNGLIDEINMLRLAMQRMISLATSQESSAAEWQKTLQALGLASQRLAKLVKIQQELTGQKDLETAEFFTTIREVMNQQGWIQD